MTSAGFDYVCIVLSCYTHRSWSRLVEIATYLIDLAMTRFTRRKLNIAVNNNGWMNYPTAQGQVGIQVWASGRSAHIRRQEGSLRWRKCSTPHSQQSQNKAKKNKKKNKTNKAKTKHKPKKPEIIVIEQSDKSSSRSSSSRSRSSNNKQNKCIWFGLSNHQRLTSAEQSIVN